MKKLIFKILGVLVLIGFLAAVYGWFFIYNKPHRNYEKAEPDFIMTAGDCYQKYAAGADEAGQFTGKVLQISGAPSLIEDNDIMVIVVFVFNEGMFGDEGIRCSMLPNYNRQARKMDISKEMQIKGYCTGYNGTDIIMEQCSFINN